MSAAATKTRTAPVKRAADAKRATANRGSTKPPVSRAAPQEKKSTVSRARSSAALFVIDVAALRSRTRRRRLVIGSLLLLVGSFFGVALVQAQLVQTQSDLDLLQSEIATLENDIALLDRSVVVASSPEEVVRRARELGMVRAVRPVYLVASRPLGQ